MLDINAIRYFSIVVDHGGVGVAARAMGLAKSTLSRNLHNLEEMLGEQLFIRESRGLRLTPFGRDFHTRCKALLDMAGQIEAMARKSNMVEDAAAIEVAKQCGQKSALIDSSLVADSASRRQDAVQVQILSWIREGQLMPGDKLPAERSLAAELGVARQAVREAIRSLEMSGVLRLERGSQGGSFVRELGPDGIAYAIRNMLVLGNLPMTDLIQLRASIFGQAAELAAIADDRSHVPLLEQNVAALARATRTEAQSETIRLSTEFYRIAAHASGNRLLAVIVDAIADIIEQLLSGLESWPYVEEGELARREALEAIRARDGQKAASIIRSHCQQTNSVLLQAEMSA